MRLLIATVLALIAGVVTKRKINKRKLVEIKEIDTVGIDWKNVDDKKE